MITLRRLNSMASRISVSPDAGSAHQYARLAATEYRDYLNRRPHLTAVQALIELDRVIGYAAQAVHYGADPRSLHTTFECIWNSVEGQ